MKPRWFLLLALSFLLAACGGKVTGTFELESGETLPANQHLVVVEATLEDDSTVEGDLNITAAGDVNINSHIKGDLTVFAANLALEDETLIEGNLIYCLVSDGVFAQDSEATIWGEIRNNCNDTSRSANLRTDEISPGVRLVGNIILSLAAGLVAALGSIFFPAQMSRIQTAAQARRWQAFGLGVLTLVVVVGLSSLWGLSLKIIVPIVLAPVIAVAWLGLLFLMLLGAVSLAQTLGIWLARLVRPKDHPPVLTTMLGAMVITFLVLSFELIRPVAFLTPLSGLLLLAWALGAALMTRAGTRLPVSR